MCSVSHGPWSVGWVLPSGAKPADAIRDCGGRIGSGSVWWGLGCLSHCFGLHVCAKAETTLAGKLRVVLVVCPHNQHNFPSPPAGWQASIYGCALATLGLSGHKWPEWTVCCLGNLGTFWLWHKYGGQNSPQEHLLLAAMGRWWPRVLTRTFSLLGSSELV